MTHEEILDFNKRCALFMGYKYFPYPAEDSGWRKEKGHLKLLNYYLGRTTKDLHYHSDWNWIMEIVSAIEKLGSYTVSGCKINGEFKISRFGILFYFSPNQNYLLQLELKPYIIDEYIWKHPMYKNHIIQVFDFKNKSKKEAVVEAINKFLIWYEKNK